MSENLQTTNKTRTELNPIVKIFLELGPLILFFLANSQGERISAGIPFFSGMDEPIYFATAVFMIAIAVSLTVSLVLVRRVPVMPLVTAVFVLVFGALTLWLQDDLFIKIKPTLVNVLFGTILLGGVVFNRVLLKFLFDGAFSLSDEGWRKLTVRWGIFFYFLAMTNEIVWRNFSTDVWVQFKVFGIMPLTFVFMLMQMPLIMRNSENLNR